MKQRARNFQRNLEVLRTRFPAVAEGVASVKPGRTCELVPARDGSYSLLVRKGGREVCYHSRFEPQREGALFADAADIADADVVICLGLGLGYHIRYLLAKLSREETALFLFESDYEILRLMLELHDWAALLRHPHVFLVCGETNMYYVLPYIKPWVNPRRYANRNWRFLMWPPAKKLDGAYYDHVREMVRDAVDHVSLVTGTDIHMVPLWPENSWQNIGHVMRSSPVKNLFGAFEGIPWIVVSSGPSLDEALDDLKALQDYAVLCCAGSAYRVLLAHGITPHFVFSVDAKQINFRHFDGIGSAQSYMIYDPMLLPAILDRNVERLFISQVMSEVHNPPMGLIRDIYGEVGVVPSGFSVATSCFSLGVLAGAEPIIFAGQDLCYHDGRTHVRGSALCAEFDEKVGIVPDYEVETNEGGRAVSARGWVATLRTFDTLVKKAGRTCYTTSWKGAKIAGAPYRSMQEIREMLAEKQPVWEIIEDRWRPLGDSRQRLERLRAGVEKAVAEVEALEEEGRLHRDLAAELLVCHLEGKENAHTRDLGNRIQAQLDRLKEDGRLGWIRPWLHEIVNYLQKSESQKEEGVDFKAWEINRAGIYFEGIQKAATEALKHMRTAKEKLKSLRDAELVHA